MNNFEKARIIVTVPIGRNFNGRDLIVWFRYCDKFFARVVLSDEAILSYFVTILLTFEQPNPKDDSNTCNMISGILKNKA